MRDPRSAAARPRRRRRPPAARGGDVLRGQVLARPLAVVAAQARARTGTARCTRGGCSNTRGPATPTRPARAAGCAPTRRRCRSRRSARGRRPRCRRRCPSPRSTPNTTRAPAPAPSVASERAKQLASLARRTGPAEARFEVAGGAAAVEPGRVRVLDQAGGGGDRARDPDADGAAPARLRLDLGDQRGDRLEGRGVVVARRGHAPPRADGVVPVEGDGLDLRPAEIDADAEHAAHARGRCHGCTRARRERRRGSGGSEAHRCACRRSPARYDCVYLTKSLSAFSGRIFTILRAGLALKIVGSLVKGLMPLPRLGGRLLDHAHLREPGQREASAPRHVVGDEGGQRAHHGGDFLAA